MAQLMQVLGGGSLLHQVARDVTTSLDRRLAHFGVTTQQAALLHNASSGLASPAQLMEAVGTDTAGMTRLLDRLEAKGLLSRRPNPRDRRSVLVEPTERGLALMPEIAPVFGEVAGQLFEGFSDDEAATFISFLHRMRENLGSSSPIPQPTSTPLPRSVVLPARPPRRRRQSASRCDRWAWPPPHWRFPSRQPGKAA